MTGEELCTKLYQRMTAEQEHYAHLPSLPLALFHFSPYHSVSTGFDYVSHIVHVMGFWAMSRRNRSLRPRSLTC